MSASDVNALSPDELAERRRRARRGAILLALVAGAFYVGFIVMTLLRGAH